MNHSDRLKTLLSRGWTCEFPDKAHECKSHSGAMMQCLYLEGVIHGAPQQIFLAVISGAVLLIKGEDYTFDGFLDYCDGKTEAPAVKPLAGQRSLWGDEES